jgi:hypothetical protein
VAHDDIAKQLARVRANIFTLNATLDHNPVNAEQEARERWQWESNLWAEQHPMYSVARSAASNHTIVPLEPKGTAPLVPVSDATRDDRIILEWYQEWPDANVGCPVSRANSLIVLQVEGDAAKARLHESAEYEQNNILQYHSLGAARVTLQPLHGVSVRHALGWAKAAEQGLQKAREQEQQRRPDIMWLAWGYPFSVDQDAWNYPNRRIGSGLTVLGDGDVLPWDGSILGDYRVSVAWSTSILPEMPAWLAPKLGRPRSRKEMDGARQQHERDLNELALGHTNMQTAILEQRKGSGSGRSSPSEPHEQGSSIG